MDGLSRWRSPRGWIAIAILVAAWFAETPVEGAIEHPVARVFGLHMVQHGAMQAAPYGLLMIIRLAWQIGVAALICAALGRSLWAFPVRGRGSSAHLAQGGVIGLAVMVAAILGIIGLGAAHAGIASIGAEAIEIGGGIVDLTFGQAGNFDKDVLHEVLGSLSRP